ncbi:MAG: hypothetical protein JWR07_1429 [Nevskia sp.]|nr:hypothetical protein [Nevskia sp.]
MATKQKSIRTSQLITPFGVGAVVEIGGESFACKDIRYWPTEACSELAENHLSRLLGLKIRQPPTKGMSSNPSAVPFCRFPAWLFCPTCRSLHRYTSTMEKANEHRLPTCSDPACKKAALVPMRFVVACEEGHLQDVDWHWWCHLDAQKGETGTCARVGSKMHFMVSGASGGDFDSMSITCACGASKSFVGLTDQSRHIKCWGHQPWEFEKATCTSTTARVYPRGASNIYYPSVLSALDLMSAETKESVGRAEGLKTWYETNVLAKSARVANGLGASRDALRGIFETVVAEGARQFGVPTSAAESAFLEWLDGTTAAPVEGASDRSQHGILAAEWPILARAVATKTRNLQARPYPTKAVWPARFSTVFEQVTLVDRLREVRVLTGFARVKTERVLPADIEGTSSWLPGIESFGEGIFIKINRAYLEQWEQAVQGAFAARSAELEAICERWGRQPADVYSSARFIALHTFAHGLVRRLSFDAGYSSSSLRERIYCGARGDGMAGILLYTSDSDSEGALGGLVRQGEPARLIGTMERTIADLSWCSGDPVCSEMARQGVDGMNAAACHACTLVSETSCVYNNSLLDRRLLLGEPRSGIPAFLGGLVVAAR